MKGWVRMLEAQWRSEQAKSVRSITELICRFHRTGDNSVRPWVGITMNIQNESLTNIKIECSGAEFLYSF